MTISDETSMQAPTGTIEVLLREERRFPPSPEFVAQANIQEPDIYDKAANDRESFWAGFADELHWFKKWDTVLEWNPPHAKWFLGGKLNIAYNCLDRHLPTPRRTKAALVWEGEPGDSKVFTYEELHRRVCQFANGLKSLGVRKGDSVAIYLPNLPELMIAMLACARLGATHNAIFSGFGSGALRDRINDSAASVLVTCDGCYRSGEVVPLWRNVIDVLGDAPSVKKVVVVQRTETDGVSMQSGRDVWWHDLVDGQSVECDAEPMDSEDILYFLYTSGTTGQPKGIVHTTAGYLVGTYATAKWVFDLKDHDVHWCTADVGGVTGHSYTVYGPLANGATTLMYEGTPDYPDRDRFWSIVEKHGVTVLYTHPTVIRSFIRWGEEYPAKHDISSLRLLGSVGEPLNPEAWMWYWQNIGAGRCPVVNTWWQTETGMILITPLPGITTLKPGSAVRPFPGVEAQVVDLEGNPVNPGQGGYLVVKGPWPAMLRATHRDPTQYQKQYWSRYPNSYFPGDGCKTDEDGYFWLLGRVDDLIHKPAHRISNMEVESALVDHKAVAEAASIGVSQSEDGQNEKGQSLVAFVTLKETEEPSPHLAEQLKQYVENKIGPVARPDEVVFADQLPKTLSGKIMRRLLRDVVEGRDIGDTTSLADIAVVDTLRKLYSERVA